MNISFNKLMKILKDGKKNVDYSGNINKNENLHSYIAALNVNNEIIVCGCTSCNIYFSDVTKTNTKNYANRHCYTCVCYWCMCDYSRIKYGYSDTLIILSKRECNCPTCKYYQDDMETNVFEKDHQCSINFGKVFEGNMYEYSMNIREFEIKLYNEYKTIIFSTLYSYIKISPLIGIILSYFDILAIDSEYLMEQWRKNEEDEN